MKTSQLIKKVNENYRMKAELKNNRVHFMNKKGEVFFSINEKAEHLRDDVSSKMKNAEGVFMVDLADLIELLNQWLETPYKKRSENRFYIKLPSGHYMRLETVSYGEDVITWVLNKDYARLFTEEQIAAMNETYLQHKSEE